MQARFLFLGALLIRNSYHLQGIYSLQNTLALSYLVPTKENRDYYFVLMRTLKVREVK